MKNSVCLCGAAVAALAWTVPVAAQETLDGEDAFILANSPLPTRIVVTATRAPQGFEEAALPVTAVIMPPEIARVRQLRDIADILRDAPGVAVSAVPGQTQIRLRGSEANHVLVLVDGIEVSDPFAGEFDLGTLQAEIGSRAELLLGPQSALYGSDAIGGVFAYYTGSGCSGAAEGYAEGGSNATFNSSARAGVCGKRGELSLNATVVSTDGEPNARPINGGGARDIGRDSYTISGKGSVELSDAFTIRAVGRYVLTEGDFNDQDFDSTSPTFGFVIDSPETRYENEAFYALAGAELRLLDQRWFHDLSVQIADIRRDSFGPFGRSFGNEGERIKASYVSSFEFTGDAGHTITFAADWEEERYRNTDPFGFAFTGTRTNENVGLVGEYRLKRDGFTVSAALRHDINDNFADATTYKLAGAVDATDTTTLFGSTGSGIKNPGFYELFGFVDGRFIGNANLRPEKSTGWEVGVRQGLFDRAVELSLTYFDNQLEDEIFTSFPAPTFIATPDNRDTVSKQRGFEFRMKASLADTLKLNAAYTYLDAEENGVTEVRRPEYVASASLDWSAPDDSASASLVIRHNGETEDFAFTDPSFIPVRVTLDDYTLVNFYGEVRLTEGLNLFGRVENLLGERYEQVFSFVSPGRTATAGVRAKF